MSIRQIGKQINSVNHVAVIIHYDSVTKEYEVESWNPEGNSTRRNVYYTDCKIDALKTAEFIAKRGI